MVGRLTSDAAEVAKELIGNYVVPTRHVVFLGRFQFRIAKRRRYTLCGGCGYRLAGSRGREAF